jgi:hypothetical protein
VTGFRIWSRSKLRGDWIRLTLATIQPRTFCLLTCCTKNLNIKIYKTIIFPVVLYGCETWSRTLREEHRLRVFENRVLRRIFGPKRYKVTGGWRKLYSEELRNLYSSPSIIRMIQSKRMSLTGQVARMGRRGMRIWFWLESQKEREH